MSGCDNKHVDDSDNSPSDDGLFRPGGRPVSKNSSEVFRYLNGFNFFAIFMFEILQFLRGQSVTSTKLQHNPLFLSKSLNFATGIHSRSQDRRHDVKRKLGLTV